MHAQCYSSAQRADRSSNRISFPLLFTRNYFRSKANEVEKKCLIRTATSRNILLFTRSPSRPSSSIRTHKHMRCLFNLCRRRHRRCRRHLRQLLSSQYTDTRDSYCRSMANNFDEFDLRVNLYVWFINLSCIYLMPIAVAHAWDVADGFHCSRNKFCDRQSILFVCVSRVILPPPTENSVNKTRASNGNENFSTPQTLTQSLTTQSTTVRENSVTK